MGFKIVIDTNIILSGLKSKKGASYKLLQNIDNKKIDLFVSVPLILEYEKVLKDNLNKRIITNKDIDDLVDYICKMSNHTKINFLWRPYLKDPNDDMILELAFNSNSKYIVTFNEKDFYGCDKFGIDIIFPQILLKKIGVIK